VVILGWHGNPEVLESNDSSSLSYHDSAAVILRDGAVVAAIEEERLNRVKHSSFFPWRAIRFCLAEANVTLREVDAIVTDSAEDFCDFVVTRDAADDPLRPFANGRDVISATFDKVFGIDVSQKLRFCRHHIAHLYGAWYPSGFLDGLAVCLDGDGDGASGLIATCRDADFKILRYLPEAISLGHFYAQQLFFLGYQAFDEYKAMGLAPYGDPAVYKSLFQRMYGLLPEGRFAIAPWNDRVLLMTENGLMKRARRKGEAFRQEHRDFAAALQAALEQIVEHVVIHFKRVSGNRNLCLSGGVAHNCKLNGNLLRSGRFQQIYIQPAAHDAGNALGAALAVAHEAGQSIQRNILRHLFFGSDIGSTTVIGDRLSAWAPLVSVRELSDAPQIAAELLAGGSVVAWVQGRSEFGPRALGNRSILADARPAENKRIINSMIKTREEYRPFAPAILEEKLGEYFEVPTGMTAAPFMVITLGVREHVQKILGAVTHVDGSARVQSVSRIENPRFHALIEAFGRLTGVPVVLNTSFNNHAEPIVDSIDDAVATFVTTGIHALIIGDWLVQKLPGSLLTDALLDLVPVVAPARKMTRRPSEDGSWRFQIESTASRYSAAPPVAVSENLFRLLLDDDNSSIRVRCEARKYDAALLSRLGAEILQLWSARAVRLAPLQANPMSAAVVERQYCFSQ
jgi:carbamoyltransferase